MEEGRRAGASRLIALSATGHPGDHMGDTDKKKKSQKKAEDKSKKPPAPAEADEDYDDGDIATPKRDGNGTDDEPL
jgi:hypothetical protein